MKQGIRLRYSSVQIIMDFLKNHHFSGKMLFKGILLKRNPFILRQMAMQVFLLLINTWFAHFYPL